MKKNNIALVAHDARKDELLEWVKYNIQTLKQHNLFATGTTGKLIESIEQPYEEFNRTNNLLQKVIKPFGENVTKLLSGPLGGDQQIGAMIAEGKIDCLIFFCDNLITQGHQQDVAALVRLASLYNIAFATNRTTADLLITSPLFVDDEYTITIPDVINTYATRKI